MVSYLLRCNTDVTCLLSGMQVKAVVAYVTDYITKSSLKMYMIFEVVHIVLDMSNTVVAGNVNGADAA